MTPRLHGIPNCDKVRAARAWLAAHAVDVEFVDFKRAPPTPALIERWLLHADLADLLNRSGTTWRRLSDAERAAADRRAGAIRLMTAHPSLIRRPVMELGDGLVVGFDPERYALTFHG